MRRQTVTVQSLDLRKRMAAGNKAFPYFVEIALPVADLTMPQCMWRQ